MNERGTGGFLHPEKILRQIGVYDGIKAADFGCGRGYFSIPLAKMIPNGMVYSFDVVDEALQVVRSKAKIEGISNIQTTRANLEIKGSSGLEDNSMDLVILANILYQSHKKKEIIQEAKRVIKEKGKIVLIEWIADSSLAPKGGWEMVSRKEAQKIAEGAGLDLDNELGEVDHQHYGLVFKR
jgi:ubiquinone/menaquinone biosynthesis C-methylase UbiE